METINTRLNRLLKRRLTACWNRKLRNTPMLQRIGVRMPVRGYRSGHYTHAIYRRLPFALPTQPRTERCTADDWWQASRVHLWNADLYGLSKRTPEEDPYKQRNWGFVAVRVSAAHSQKGWYEHGFAMLSSLSGVPRRRWRWNTFTALMSIIFSTNFIYIGIHVFAKNVWQYHLK